MRAPLRYFRIKRFLHFWFGREPVIEQFGDYSTIGKVLSVLDKNELKNLIGEQILTVLWEVKGEDCKGTVVVRFISARPDSDDPLAQINTVFWKSDIILHTRKTWKKYLRSLLAVNVEMEIT